MLATPHGHEAVVARLLAAGADPSRNNGQGWTARMYAVLYNRQGIIRPLAGTPAISLADAAAGGDIAALRLYLRQGIRIDEPDRSPLKLTPLERAAMGGHAGAVDARLVAGAGHDPVRSSAPAEYAAERGWVDALELLLRGRVPPGRSLIEAAAHGQEATVRCLLAYGMPAAEDALRTAAGHGHTSVMAILLAAGAQLDGILTAELAAEYGRIAAIECLLDAGMPINAPGRDGWTLLHIAAYHCQDELVATLLARGADPSLRSFEQRTALEYARDNGCTEVEALLDER